MSGMINKTLCEGCSKPTNSLRFWFGKYLCHDCYEKGWLKQPTIAFNPVEQNYFETVLGRKEH